MNLDRFDCILTITSIYQIGLGLVRVVFVFFFLGRRWVIGWHILCATLCQVQFLNLNLKSITVKEKRMVQPTVLQRFVSSKMCMCARLGRLGHKNVIKLLKKYNILPEFLNIAPLSDHLETSKIDISEMIGVRRHRCPDKANVLLHP